MSNSLSTCLSRSPIHAIVVAAAAVLGLAHDVHAAPRWVLTYARQYGEAMTGGVAGQVELFSFGENGRPIRVGMTNEFNRGIAIFGTTDTYGNSRVAFDINNRTYDFQVHDPGTPTDESPVCHWLDLPHHGHYRFEFHWMLTDDALVTGRPETPAYHYDRVQGFNTASREAPGFATDPYELTDWTTYQAQTFVVPPGQNRIVAAKAFCVRRAGERFRMRATIRRGGPTGQQIGPVAASREVFSNEFPNVTVFWPLDGVPVVAGETYALRLDSANGEGFNVYATGNNYRDGELYNGATRLPGKDMIAVVIGVSVQEDEPEIEILRTDCNQDSQTNLSDPVKMLGYLFLGESINCLDACDGNDTGTIDLADAVSLLNHLFLGDEPPTTPFPPVCAPDGTKDELDCAQSNCE